jgi:hypothetical protein
MKKTSFALVVEIVGDVGAGKLVDVGENHQLIIPAELNPQSDDQDIIWKGIVGELHVSPSYESLGPS